MQIKDAKQIPLKEIIEQLGGKYAHTRKNEDWYYSPFRPNERTASFKVNLATNTWFDFGHSDKGGDTIDLWCDYHSLERKAGVKQALEALESFSHIPSAYPSVKRNRTVTKQTASEPRYIITKLYPRIFNATLQAELQRRKIDQELANRYLNQAHICDRKFLKRKLIGFAFENEKQGYEISIPNPTIDERFKTSIGGKTFSRIEGTDPSRVIIFEGFWDFLSYLQMNKLDVPDAEAYILNSISFCKAVGELIVERKHGVKLVKSFLDNDEAGQRATMILADKMSENDIPFGTMEHLYEGHKDLSDWFTEI